MHRAMILFFIVLIWQIWTGCQSTDSAKGSDARNADTSFRSPDTTSVLSPTPVQPPAIKPNLTFVGAAFDSVIHIDSVRYKAYLFVGTAFAEPGKDSFLEPGQRISAEPLYVLSEDGKIDLSNPRNAKLFSLYNEVPTSSFIGKITLIPGRGWFIVEVDS